MAFRSLTASLALLLIPTFADASGKATASTGVSRNFKMASEAELVKFPVVHLRGDRAYYLSDLHLVEVDPRQKIARIAWCVEWDEPGQNEDCPDIASRIIDFTELDEDPLHLSAAVPKYRVLRAKTLPKVTTNAPVLSEDQLNAFPLVGLRDDAGKFDGTVHLIQLNRKTGMARVAWAEGWDEPDQNSGIAGINSKLVWTSHLDLGGPNLNGSRYARPRPVSCKSPLSLK